MSGKRRLSSPRIRAQGAALGLCLALASGCAHKQNVWRLVQEPLAGPSRIYGSVTAGCIAGAEAVGDGQREFILMRTSRLRYFAHPFMKRYLLRLSQRYFERKKELLMIGDVAQPRGGPFGAEGEPLAHTSHQTGIDADIWFRTSKTPLSAADREQMTAKPVVAKDGDTMTKAWDLDQAESLLKMAASAPEVERIFVHPAIKREFCIHSRGGGRDVQWLRKIRPWYGHDDHFHVRLVCPEGNLCRKTSEAIPPGDGCDETLNWWFSDEAKQKMKERAPVFRMPELPPECAELLPAALKR